MAGSQSSTNLILSLFLTAHKTKSVMELGFSCDSCGTAAPPLHKQIVSLLQATAASASVSQNGIVYYFSPPLDRKMTTMSVLPQVIGFSALVLLWTLSGTLRRVEGNMFAEPVCNVTEETGLTVDCAQVISYLQFLDMADCCVQEHRHCTTLHVAGTCRAQICSLPFVPLPRCQSCAVVAEYVRSLTNLCAEDIAGESRSGGVQVMREDAALFIVLY